MEKSIYSSNNITSDDKYRLYSSVNSYIRNRIDSTYSQNCQGNVKGDESAISDYSSVNWNKPVKGYIKEIENNNNINLNNIQRTDRIRRVQLENIVRDDLAEFLADLRNIPVEAIVEDE